MTLRTIERLISFLVELNSATHASGLNRRLQPMIGVLGLPQPTVLGLDTLPRHREILALLYDRRTRSLHPDLYDLACAILSQQTTVPKAPYDETWLFSVLLRHVLPSYIRTLLLSPTTPTP